MILVVQVLTPVRISFHLLTLKASPTCLIMSLFPTEIYFHVDQLHLLVHESQRLQPNSPEMKF